LQRDKFAKRSPETTRAHPLLQEWARVVSRTDDKRLKVWTQFFNEAKQVDVQGAFQEEPEAASPREAVQAASREDPSKASLWEDPPSRGKGGVCLIRLPIVDGQVGALSGFRKPPARLLLTELVTNWQ